MKYIKQFENIDWSFDEEENEKTINNLKNYYIQYNTEDECADIMDKLMELGYNVYDYGNYGDWSEWDGFIYEDGEWVQTKKYQSPSKLEIINYIDIKNL